MAVDNIKLTKNHRALAKVIDRHVEKEESRLAYRRTMWLLAWYYLNGARRFDVFDPNTGLLRPHVLDEEGNMEYQNQELMSAIDRVSGRLASADLRASVVQNGFSLQGSRDRAIAQVIDDALVSEDQIELAKTNFAHHFTALGSCGIMGHIVDHPTIGLTADLEVVHPREIYPFPSLADDYNKLRGIIRQRVVPIDYLKEKFGRKIADNMKFMEWWEVQAGDELDDRDETDIFYGGINAYIRSTAELGGTEKTTRDAHIMGLAKIRELWLFGPRNTVNRYVVSCGEYIIEDLDFEGLEVYCPLGFARFMENGSFHGLGLFDLLFSIHRQMELLLKSLFNNIRDVDRYGVMVLPQGEFNERATLKEVGSGLRAYFWQPDPVDTGFKPFAIQPFSLGDVPGKVAAFAKELMQGINPVQDLIQEKGRIDSAAGLSFLDEEVTRAMTNPSRGLRLAWSTMHRSVIGQAATVLATSPRPLPVSKLTLELAGAVIDQSAGTISFPENPLPTMGQLRVSVRETKPRSMVARKQEALELFDREGLMDPDGLKLLVLREGLDLALYMEEEKSAYETVVRNCLLLYGDGQSPGEVVVTPETARPEFQMRVLSGFMASPMMAVASPDVIDAFKGYREFLLDAMGMALPAAVPNPDDMAVLMGAADEIMGTSPGGGQGQQQQQVAGRIGPPAA